MFFRKNSFNILKKMLLIPVILMWSGGYAQDQTETLFWQSVDCTATDQVNAYLESYPDGAYFGAANRCLQNNEVAGPAQSSGFVKDLLSICKEYLGNFSISSGVEAYSCFTDILIIEPNNYEAVKGLQKIEHNYASKAMDSISDGNVEIATTNLDTLKRINDSHPSIIVIQATIQEFSRTQKLKETQAAESVVAIETKQASEPVPVPEPEPKVDPKQNSEAEPELQPVSEPVIPPEPEVVTTARVITPPVLLTAPSVTIQEKLVDTAVRQFALAVEDKSMAQFYKTLSMVWQSQTSVSRLDSVFSGFYNWSGDLVSLLGSELPRINPANNVDENDIITIQGSYSGGSQQVEFKQKFLYEKSSWKLIGFNINIK
jgi:hypothetical protein